MAISSFRFLKKAFFQFLFSSSVTEICCMCKQFNGSLKGCYATELYKTLSKPRNYCKGETLKWWRVEHLNIFSVGISVFCQWVCRAPVRARGKRLPKVGMSGIKAQARVWSPKVAKGTQQCHFCSAELSGDYSNTQLSKQKALSAMLSCD